MKTTLLKHFIILMTLYSSYSCSQSSNRVDYQGISFEIPAGWIGQEAQNGYILTSPDNTGFILVATNNNSDLNTMIAEVRQGTSDGNGNYLQLVSNLETFNSQVIGGEYEGVLNGQYAKTYIIGIANSAGAGISITAGTATNLYSNAYKQLCLDLANTIEINQPQQSQSQNKMEEFFAGARLSYFNSGDGYGTKIIIDLCAAGYFYHSSADSMGVDVGGASAGYGDNSNGAGTWSILENANETPILQLKFRGGKLYEYYITFNGKKTYLDGRRYFRVYGEEGARCN